MADQATLVKPLPPIVSERLERDAEAKRAESGATTGSEVQVESGASMTPFQAATYGVGVVTFVLAGFGAVLLYKKTMGRSGRRFVTSAKILATTLVLACIHGFVATYLYSNYLRSGSDEAPVSFSFLLWILLGATTGYISNRLIAKDTRLKTSDAIVDASLLVAVFAMVAVATSSQTGTNLGLILSLAALITYSVPLSRFFIACKRFKFNQQVRQQQASKGLLYTLVLLPGVLPVIALLFLAEVLGADLTVFTVNLLAALLIVIACINIISALKRVEQEKDAVVGTRAGAATVPSGPQMDPLVTELLAEEAQQKSAGDDKSRPAPAQPMADRGQNVEKRLENPKFTPKAKTAPRPKAPEKTQPSAPKKPEKHSDAPKPPPKPPSKIVAPAKPKKRI